MTRRQIVRAGLRAMGRRKGNGRYHTMGWLAEQIGVSRQALYQVLNLEERSEPIEAVLTDMFPELPEWPVRWGSVDGAMSLEEFLRS